MELVWFAATLVLGTVVAAMLIALRFLLWPLYVQTRDERDEFEVRLLAVIRDRDGWKGVADRALLVAQIGLNVTKRASTVVVKAKNLAIGGP